MAVRDIAQLAEEHLQHIPYRIQRANAVTIGGVLTRPLTVHLDGRGSVTELWSSTWSGGGIVRAEHVYQSVTDYGVVKCWHLHAIHTDQFVITRGKAQVSLVDVRSDSETLGQVNVIFAGFDRPLLIQIPPGVMHGWKALLPPELIVTNFQSHPYDPTDEFKFQWDAVLAEIWEPRNG
ncbi:MAG: dTDP-4-dehydrorhamnose 3,5-epimerase family protein [Chloroflexi bacterium]|nr:dTDP-4-dehydrorhamnose 3,5-epimerase family protein [Chloroflexota bacterium]